MHTISNKVNRSEQQFQKLDVKDAPAQLWLLLAAVK
jgi:hypothetical protein